MLSDQADLERPTIGRRRIIVHAGMHKTGSKSIQAFLHKFRPKFLALGIDPYCGMYSTENHVELHLAAMRPERMSAFKTKTGLMPDDALLLRVRERLQNFTARSECRSIVFSAEGLSYLRYEDEMDRLRTLLPEGDIQIIMYRRKLSDFLASYAAEMTKHWVPEPVDRDSFAYIGSDSWLLDFDDRIERFRMAFQAANVNVIDYDNEVHQCGNVIPSFLRVLGVEDAFSLKDWSTFFLNRRDPSCKN